MIAEGLNTLHFSAIALIVAFLTALGWLGTDINCCHHPANLWLITRVPDGQVSQSPSVSNRALPAAH